MGLCWEGKNLTRLHKISGKGKKSFKQLFYLFKKTKDRLPVGCSPLIAMDKKDRVAARLAAFTPQERVTKHTSVVSTCDSYASLKELP